MIILGLNSAYHESAVCLMKDGVVLFALEEERFNRIKHAKPALINNPDELPLGAINYVLEHANIAMSDVAHIAYSILPKERLKSSEFDEAKENGGWGTRDGEAIFLRARVIRAK